MWALRQIKAWNRATYICNLNKKNSDFHLFMNVETKTFSALYIFVNFDPFNENCYYKLNFDTQLSLWTNTERKSLKIDVHQILMDPHNRSR